MDGTRDFLSHKEKDKCHMISLISEILYMAHMISLISGIKYMAQMYLSTEKKLMDLENRFAVAKGEEVGMGWTGSLESIDANYCLWNG